MNKARCKFRVASVTDHGGNFRQVHLETMYDANLPEDQKFCDATPSGDMKIAITNPAVFPVFKAGSYVYVDVVPVEDAGAG